MQMTELTEWCKTLGVNFSVLAAVSLTDVELYLKIIVLALTAAWSTVRLARLLKKEDTK
jgi:hypothetical protein